MDKIFKLAVIVLWAASLAVAYKVATQFADFKLKGKAVETGRYQLCSGTVTTVAEDTRLTDPAILKIDTATGKTWMFIRKLSEEKGLTHCWGEIKGEVTVPIHSK